MITNSIESQSPYNKYIVQCFKIRYCDSYENSDGLRLTRVNFDKFVKTEDEALSYIKKEQEKYRDRDYQYSLYFSEVTYNGSLDEAIEWFIKSMNVMKK